MSLRKPFDHERHNAAPKIFFVNLSVLRGYCF